MATSASDAFGDGAFPHLDTEGWRETSPRDAGYNCIAWVAGDSSRHWWPPDSPPQIHWPIDGDDETVDGFVKAFQTLGFEQCDHGELEHGYDKIAFYADDSGVSHAARQLPSGLWTSKVGKNIDIEHTLAGLAGGQYGQIVAFMKRPVPSSTTQPGFRGGASHQ